LTILNSNFIAKFIYFPLIPLKSLGCVPSLQTREGAWGGLKVTNVEYTYQKIKNIGEVNGLL